MDKRIIWGSLAVGAGLAALIWSQSASAADLGGNCCADLEERIAELEATTARKGNKKVSLTVYGQVNAGLLYVDIADYSNTKIVNNGTDESFVGFAGSARISPRWSAGYVLELDLHQLGLLDSGLTSHEPRVRQSYWYINSDDIGSLSIGRQRQATSDFDKITTANTAVVAKPFSVGAVSDEYLTGIDIPFDGHYREIVRYDSPLWAGFVASASWGASLDATSSDGNGNTWDVALRYAGEYSGFKLVGAVGYRKDTDLEINLLNIVNLQVPTGDVKTKLAVASIMHMTSGVFLTGNYADQDWDTLNFSLKGWQLTGGLEQRWFSVGKSTVYGEWGNLEFASGGSFDVDYWGLGFVQALDNAAMDLYVGYRAYDLGSETVSSATAGGRVRF